MILDFLEFSSVKLCCSLNVVEILLKISSIWLYILLPASKD